MVLPTARVSCFYLLEPNGVTKVLLYHSHIYKTFTIHMSMFLLVGLGHAMQPSSNGSSPLRAVSPSLSPTRVGSSGGLPSATAGSGSYSPTMLLQPLQQQSPGGDDEGEGGKGSGEQRAMRSSLNELGK